MDKILEFDFMYYDTVCEHVEIDLETMNVQSIVYTDEIMLQVFGKRPKTIENVHHFFRNRCFEETNYGLKDLLGLLGLKQYSPYDIVRITHGKVANDQCWIRFAGEKLTYQELYSIPFEEEVRLGHERIKKMDGEVMEFRRNQLLGKGQPLFLL